MTGRAQEKQRKRVHYVRHKLQKMLFPKKNKAGAKVRQEEEGFKASVGALKS